VKRTRFKSGGGSDRMSAAAVASHPSLSGIMPLTTAKNYAIGRAYWFVY